MRIACLHTADSNIAVFNAAARRGFGTALELTHAVRADLLTAAAQAGGLTVEIVAQTRHALLALCNGADAVLLTCSTLGPVVDKMVDKPLAQAAPVPVLRVDAALAQRAIERGGKIVVLCAVSTTLEPTTRLFEQTQMQHAHANPAAVISETDVEVQLVAGAWERFKAGDIASYLSAIADAAHRAYADGADVVALAQASMADASALIGDDRTLNSPDTGLEAVRLAVLLAQTGGPQHNDMEAG